MRFFASRPGAVSGPSVSTFCHSYTVLLDPAYAASAADKKRVRGSVVGAAEVMLSPDLASANLTVKAIMYTADCEFGGVLCGAACPVVFMSRADTTTTRLRSLALALRLIAPPLAASN